MEENEFEKYAKNNTKAIKDGEFFILRANEIRREVKTINQTRGKILKYVTSAGIPTFERKKTNQSNRKL